MAALKVLPEGLWNFDETAIVALELAKTLIECGIEQSSMKAVVHDYWTKHLTVAIAISAAGAYAAPLFIMEGKTFSANFLHDALPSMPRERSCFIHSCEQILFSRSPRKARSMPTSS
jgi:hypothetical protein